MATSTVSPGNELGPADARARALVVLLGREGDAAVLPVDAGAQDLGQVALGGDVLDELVLRCAAR